jgi:hypothetical protein
MQGKDGEIYILIQNTASYRYKINEQLKTSLLTKMYGFFWVKYV